jgi:phosphotransferase system IIA component
VAVYGGGYVAPNSAAVVAPAAGGGVQQVPSALHAEFVRIVSGLPELVRVGVLQQVGPAGVADFVRVYHERTAATAAAAAAGRIS